MTRPPRDEEKANIVEIWKAIVEVQRHFNEMSMRIRGMFVTILLAFFAAIGFLIDKRLGLEFGPLRVQFSVIVPAIGIFGTWLFYFIDRYWYHRLLVGAVKHAIGIENKYKDELPELSLSDAIGKESPYEPRGVLKYIARLLVQHEKFRTTGQLHSDGKIELFYKTVMLVLVITMFLVALSGGVSLVPSPFGGFHVMSENVWGADFATAVGLLITAIGAGWTAKAVFVSEVDAITIAASRWAPETHEQGMQIPTVINLLKASRAAKVGLWMICVGTGLQVIPILMRLFL